VDSFSLIDIIFYLTATFVLVCGCYATFSRNLVRAVFSLLGLFFGVAVLYGLLAADFVAIVQLLVYVGGILVLLLFAVMLTTRIESAKSSNTSSSMILGVAVGIAAATFLVSLAINAPWKQSAAAKFEPTTESIGQALLGPVLLPFESVSVLLLGVVIGAVIIARLRSSAVRCEPADDEQDLSKEAGQ
jgi:NADH-quinone oxidoreductase subunit J